MQINPPRTYWQFIYYYYSTVLLRNPNNNVRDNDSWRFTTILSSLYTGACMNCSVVAAYLQVHISTQAAAAVVQESSHGRYHSRVRLYYYTFIHCAM